MTICKSTSDKIHIKKFCFLDCCKILLLCTTLILHSSHPYLFFNQDEITFTFVGFMVNSNGDLCDPTQRGSVLERGIMPQQLYTGLKTQNVNFDEDYRHWPKNVMIEKISTVMGIDWPHDPDPTYVLTVDNLIKILAIQMRFRFI